MAEATGIEWCDSTFNPWIGCTKVSPACDHCYAERQDEFRKWTPEGWGGPRKRTSAANWRHPLQWWEREHELFYARHGRRRRVFCASLADVFDNQVPTDWRRDLFALIEQTPNLDWLLLTKRIGNAEAMLNECAFGRWNEGPLPNIWLGATVCNQEEADRDTPKLLAVPAHVRFLSIEPMLGPIDLTQINKDRVWTIDALRGDYCREWDDDMGFHDIECIENVRRLDWVIAGGESGPQARPSHPDWFRSLRDQCALAGVPFLFKQWGEWGPPHGGFARDSHRWPIEPGEKPGGVWSYRLGKKATGRLLDGKTHDGFPVVERETESVSDNVACGPQAIHKREEAT